MNKKKNSLTKRIIKIILKIKFIINNKNNNLNHKLIIKIVIIIIIDLIHNYFQILLFLSLKYIKLIYKNFPKIIWSHLINMNLILFKNLFKLIKFQLKLKKNIIINKIT